MCSVSINKPLAWQLSRKQCPELDINRDVERKPVELIVSPLIKLQHVLA